MRDRKLVRFEEPRPLTAAERDLLDFLIHINTRHSRKLRTLFRGAKVTGECDCGCGSITLTCGGPFDGKLPNDPHFGAFLFADLDGACLESIWRPGGRFRLPRRNELRAFSNQWVESRDERTRVWLNTETGERRHQVDRPDDLVLPDEGLD